MWRRRRLQPMKSQNQSIEWPTVAALAAVYALFVAVLFLGFPLWIAVPVLAVCIAFQSSLQHEIIHGHPFANQTVNAALVYPSLNLVIPFARFRDTHLAHHKNENLTDPYEDPESNYLSPARWSALCILRRPVLRLNNTLLGRLVLGPVVGQVYFMVGDMRAIAAGDRRILKDWIVHICLAAALIFVVSRSTVPIWAYAIAAYGGLSLLKIRTFAEHQAHDRVGGRSVVIEDRGPLALLFLNNNYHAVHHMHPKLPWYELPQTYRLRKDRFLRRNLGYVFASYRDLFALYLWKAKDPVIHPHWQDPAE